MVKFRKSAVNAGSRDQQVAIVGILRETVMTKLEGPRPEPCTILALMVQMGEIAEGKKLLRTMRYGHVQKVCCQCRKPVAIIGIFRETVSTVFRFKAR